jgi:hypothetical protein
MNRRPLGPALAQHVLIVHRRNGGTLDAIDTSLRLLDPVLRIDSLDLAEILVALERDTGASPFDATPPPRTWGDVEVWLQSLPRPLPAAQGPPAEPPPCP